MGCADCMKSCFCPCNYVKLSRWTKGLSFLVAVLLILVGILRLINITNLLNVPAFVVTIYFFMFALIIIFLECKVRRMQKIFYFYNYGWGKFLLFFFLGCMCVTGVSNGNAYGIIIGIVFFIVAFVILIMTLCYRKEEKEKLEAELQGLSDNEAPP